MATQTENVFLEACSEIVGTGAFHSTGESPFFFPKLRIRGFDELAFPLPLSQAKSLLEFAEAAPYGKGELTIQDEKVRKCGQIDVESLTIDSPEWRVFLKSVLAQVRKDLGIAGPISAHLYKLLVYGKGGHFRAHRDTEKLNAMFGTLLIALPSTHEGGRLVIRHDAREVEVDFSREAHRHEYQYAAFFADCEHEVEPVRSGYRCCLVYNLRLDKGKVASLNPAPAAQIQSLMQPLSSLKNERVGELTAVLLEHSYTEANFSLAGLKGNDRNRARAILAAAKANGMHAHLALLTLYQMGELDVDYDLYSTRRRRRHWEEEEDATDGSMGEIHEESLTLGPWRDANDNAASLGLFNISSDVLLPENGLKGSDPDEKEAEGYTGNAGCTMEYWYHRAAVVLWSAEDHERILCRYNPDAATAELSRMADNQGMKASFRRLATAMIERYPGVLPPPGSWQYERESDKEQPMVSLIETLILSSALELLRSLLTRVPGEQLSLVPSPTWKRIFKEFGVEAFADLFERWLKEPDSRGLRTTRFQVLNALITRKQDGNAWVMRFALCLALSASRWSADRSSGSVPKEITACREEVWILLAAAPQLQTKAERKSVLNFLKADQSLDYIRQILGPVLAESFAGKQKTGHDSTVGEARAFARPLLEAEVRRPLPPFPDWCRPMPNPAENDSPLGIWASPRWSQRTSTWKKELQAFMADPKEESYRFARVQGERSEIENYIRQHDLDLDCETLTKRRPYTLLCTKNDRSHQLALKQRSEDEALLAMLNP